MKTKAFIQAVIILSLLAVSWLLFLTRSRQTPPVPVEDPVVAEESLEPAEAMVPEAVAKEEIPAPASNGTAIKNLSAVPPQWQEWMNYLKAQNSPAEREAALMAMREAIFTMSKEDGSARLIELILCGADLETGMAFNVGEGGKLTGAPTMQVLLVDWLGQMDPASAAGLAGLALNGGGTGLGPDLYVLHMRNYAWGTPVNDPARAGLLRTYLEQLLAHEPWISHPTHSVAEAMDVAVYLKEPRLVAPVAKLMGEGQSPALRHASGLAMERMVDQSAVAAIGQILATPEGRALPAASRAALVARLDPVDEPARTLLKDYLQPETTSREEAALFLANFPNLNQSLSHNLLSNNNSITEPSGHMELLQRALDEVRAWQADPEIIGLDSPLEQTATRLVSQISGTPAP